MLTENRGSSLCDVSAIVKALNTFLLCISKGGLLSEYPKSPQDLSFY